MIKRHFIIKCCMYVCWLELNVICMKESEIAVNF